MTKSLPHSRHPSTPLRMTTFVALSNLLLRQPLYICPTIYGIAGIAARGRTPTTNVSRSDTYAGEIICAREWGEVITGL